MVNRGGAGSSKSHSVAQLFLSKFIQEKNKKFLIIRKTLPSLRISMLILWNELLDKSGISNRVGQEKQSLNFLYGKNLLHFASLDDPEKIKSTNWNYILMEEANEFTYDDFQILKLRLREPSKDGKRNQLFMLFNPISAKHWIKEKVIDGEEDCQEITSTYKDNPFLSPDYIRTLEDLQKQDPNLHRIYALGEWGVLEHLIYSNWDIVDYLPEGGEDIYGLDFGFNNPTALGRIRVKDGEPYCEELIYQSGLTNSDLIERMIGIVDKKAPIYADHAEPQRIEEIHRAGFNIHPADKSVKDGIDFVKRKKVHILRSSSNWIREKQSYSWKKDRNGTIIDEPVKFMDHCMDLERYALYTHCGERIAMPGLAVVDRNYRPVGERIQEQRMSAFFRGD